MSEYQVRVRYAGSILVEIEAENEAEAQEKGELKAQSMDSDTFVSALEPQHLGTEVTRLCPKCGREIPGSQPSLCAACGSK
jgi:hypothetical protein